MKTQWFKIVICLFVYWLSMPLSWADMAADLRNELPLEDVLQNALAQGTAFEDVLHELVTLRPDRIEEIIYAAADILPPDVDRSRVILVAAVATAKLPPFACGGQSCEDLVVRAAKQLEVDPAIVPPALITGRTHNWYQPSGGIDWGWFDSAGGNKCGTEGTAATPSC